MFGNNKKAVLEMPADSARAGGGTVEYAGFWARVAALMVDSAILTIVGIVLMVGLGMAMGGTGVTIGNLVFILLQLLYWPLLESSERQATFGKRLLGIEVTDLDGHRLSFVKALLRHLAKIISYIPLGIGFLLAAFTGRKQALHDIITSCLVVRTGPSGFLKAVLVTIVAFAIAGYGMYYYVTRIFMQQKMDRAFKGMEKDLQREMEKAMKGMGKDMAKEMERAMKQAEADMKRQMEQARQSQKAPSLPPPAAKAPAPTPPAAVAPKPEPKPQVATVTPTPPATAPGTKPAAPPPAKPAAAPEKPTAVAAAPGKPAPAPATEKSAAVSVAPAPAAAPVPAEKPRTVRRAAPRKPAASVAPAAVAPVASSVSAPRYNDVMTAVMNRDRPGATEALEAGVWVDRADSNGVTPLMAAALHGDAPMVQLLLKYGANPNRSGPGGSVLDYASRSSNAQVLALLKKAGAR